MKSKYLSSIFLKDDLYAVYNSLLCMPIYMTKKRKRKYIFRRFKLFFQRGYK